MTPFNKPMLFGDELEYIRDAIQRQKISGNGYYTKMCQSFLRTKYGYGHCFLTTSCTDALEMSAILLNVGPNDEVIVPSYTFVSSANPFLLRGARIVFADSSKTHPNVDPVSIVDKITKKTRVIVLVHYAGIACDIDVLKAAIGDREIYIVEDAAQAIDSYYRGEPLGRFGILSAFSFHETKNVICGEGGLLVVNDEKLVKRAEIIWEKGTNRASFWRGEVSKYEWVDVGSSYLPSELNAAYLFAQLQKIEAITTKRMELWNRYYERLQGISKKGIIGLPEVPQYSSNNGHIFYILVGGVAERNGLIEYLRDNGYHAVFHYLALHRSEYYVSKYGSSILPNAEKYEERLLRLPMYYELSLGEVDRCVELIEDYFEK